MNARSFRWINGSLALLVLGIASASMSRAEAPATAAAFSTDAVRQSFLKIIDRPRVELAAEESEPKSVGDGIEQHHFTYATDAKQRVPGIMVKPVADDAKPRPVVIFLHGTSGKKEDELGLLKRYALKGFIAVAIDGRYHGERAKQYGDYFDRIAKKFAAGDDDPEHPLYFDTVWDEMRLIDWLVSRPDVDSKRIGMLGISKGGIETYLTGAIDPRIAVVVPCIGMQSFRWALDHNAWQGRVGTFQKAFDASLKSEGLTNADTPFVKRFYDRVIPGIDTQFDGPLMIRLIAPRPLLIINGEKDDKTPIDGVDECEASAKEAYGDHHAVERFERIIERGQGHTVTPEAHDAAEAWFIRWLQPRF